MAHKILIADDEKEVAELLRLYLEKDSNTVFEAQNGSQALNFLEKQELDCAVLDVMMSELNGFQLLKKIREKSKIPVLMLSARISSADKILALDLGADDYVTKPFDPLEVAARIKAHIRRYKNLPATEKIEEDENLSLANLVLDTKSCVLFKDGKETELTSTEFKILRLLFSSPGRVFTKNQIVRSAWGDEFVEDNSIMVALSKLRAKLGGGVTIKNIRALGYRLEENAAKESGK